MTEPDPAPPTKKSERAEATRGALLRVARELFATGGYAGTATEDIVRGARVTRGALYHHFDGKQDLFRAVYEDLEQELVERLAAAAAAEPRPERHLEVGCHAMLDACLEPAFRRIVLLDGPSVLGWELWHELDVKYGLELIRVSLEAAMDAGYVRRQPAEPLSRLLLGALNEAGLSIARASDVQAARAEMGDSLALLLDGLKPGNSG